MTAALMTLWLGSPAPMRRWACACWRWWGRRRGHPPDRGAAGDAGLREKARAAFVEMRDGRARAACATSWPRRSVFACACWTAAQHRDADSQPAALERSATATRRCAAAARVLAWTGDPAYRTDGSPAGHSDEATRGEATDAWLLWVRAMEIRRKLAAGAAHIRP